MEHNLMNIDLPEGYEKRAIVARKFLLDLRHKAKVLEANRPLMLERLIREYITKKPADRKQIKHGSVAGTAYLLSETVRR